MMMNLHMMGLCRRNPDTKRQVSGGRGRRSYDRLPCYWDRTGYSTYETACESSFIFTDGSVDEDGFKYCPYCGNVIEVREETP